MQIKLASRRGVSPLISTWLIMVTTMLALSVTLGYTQSTLTRKNGETDFESAKNFMRNLGLQVDDVAWVKGRVDTVHFTSQYGQLEYLPGAVTYTIDFYDASNAHLGSTVIVDCDIFMYNMPVEKYYLEEGYYQTLISEGDDNLILTGVNAPVTRVFATQSSIVGNNQYLRIALVPAIRYQSYNVTYGATTRYIRLYIPKLQPGYSSNQPKSVVLTGLDINTEIRQGVRKIVVSVDFPLLDQNYDNNFFKFQPPGETITLTANTNVELYTGIVRLDYGA